MTPAETRIVAALHARPLTAPEIAKAAYMDQSRARVLLHRLSDRGLVKQGSIVPRKPTVRGIAPRYWEVT